MISFHLPARPTKTAFSQPYEPFSGNELAQLKSTFQTVDISCFDDYGYKSGP